MRLRIVVAPSGWKESLSAEEAGACIERGILSACPDAHVVVVPVVDGGEGFTRTLVNVTGGTWHPIVVTGPVGDPVDAAVGLLGGTGPLTGVLEIAAGLRIVPRDRRDPLRTTTYGVGELIGAALDHGAGRLLIGCGDSGTNDGGAGMAQALGVRLLRADGATIGTGGAALLELERIDMTGRDARLKTTRIDVACNIGNLLCGPNGVARVFGPQQGASPETVALLDRAFEHFAHVVARELGFDLREMPGGGASGGLGAGLHAFLGAELYSRYDIVMRYLALDTALAEADLVFTAEGAIDSQTPFGKGPAEVARRAKRHGLPVIVLAGTVGTNARINCAHGIDAYFSVLQRPCTLDDAIAGAGPLLTACAEQAMRAVLVGMQAGAVPAIGAGSPWPDLDARTRAVFGNRLVTPGPSDMVIEERGER